MTALKNAAPADRVKDAYTIKATALNGGHGPKVQWRAQALEKKVATHST